MTPSRIYLSPPHLGGDEWLYAKEALDTNWVSSVGHNIDAFEAEVCAITGAKAACALSSGTAAIHIALCLLDLKPGDSVFCPSLTFIASANPIVYAGATPVFIDSQACSWNLDPDLIDEALAKAARQGRLPKAIVTVDLYGQACDYARIRNACATYGIPLIQDSAEAIGATWQGQSTTRQGDLGIFSFNGNKIITTSSGGMLLSDDPARIARARFLATQARDPALHYQHSHIGFNYRMSNVLAGIGRGQLPLLSARVAARRSIFDTYVARLGHLPGFTFQPEAPWGTSNRWLTCIQVDPTQAPTNRDRILHALADANIESRPVWKPMHLQPVFASAPNIGGAVSERLFANGLCLPSGSAMTPADLDRVCSVIEALWD